jgi:hypothetical protein
LNAAAFAASDIADLHKAVDLTNPAIATLADVAAEFGPRLQNWSAWENAVNGPAPVLGILIPHLEDGEIYIGAADGLNDSTLSFGKAPIALILGCSSAVGVIPYLSLPAQILSTGHTKVVVSTLTGILGRHANGAALQLGRRIRAASNERNPVTLGDFIVQMRRDFLAQGVLAGFVLVALGDADISFGS